MGATIVFDFSKIIIRGAPIFDFWNHATFRVRRPPTIRNLTPSDSAQILREEERVRSERSVLFLGQSGREERGLGAG